MSGPSPITISLTARQRAILEQTVRRATSPQRLVQRVKIILASAEQYNNQQIADQQGLTRNCVAKWRGRWEAASERMTALETEGKEDKELREKIEMVLADAPRPGAPAKFTAEQVVKIVAVACEEPQTCGRPVTEWTPTELADEVMQRKLVDRISPRSVGRFLKVKLISSHT